MAYPQGDDVIAPDSLITKWGRSHQALTAFLDAERVSTSMTRHSPLVREAVKARYRRAPVSGGAKSSPLLALAERCRAVA